MVAKFYRSLVCVALVALSANITSMAAEFSHPRGEDREQRPDEKKREDEFRRKDEAVSKLREPWRNEDLTNRKTENSTDAEQLRKKLERQEQNNKNITEKDIVNERKNDIIDAKSESVNNNKQKLIRSAEELSIEVVGKRNEKGNYGLGSATAEITNRAGRDFVGEDARQSSDGTALVSKDELRQYRFPQYKARIDKVQANFERRPAPKGEWASNGHVDIVHE